MWLDCAWSFLSQTLLGCDERHEVNNRARYANVERAMNDVMREKEIVDNKLEDSIFVAKIRKGKVHLGGCRKCILEDVLLQRALLCIIVMPVVSIGETLMNSLTKKSEKT